MRLQGLRAQLQALGRYGSPGGRQARAQRKLRDGLRGFHDGLRPLQNAFHVRGGRDLLMCRRRGGDDFHFGNRLGLGLGGGLRLHVVAPRLREHLLLILFHRFCLLFHMYAHPLQPDCSRFLCICYYYIICARKW